jgi:hypothetical protein
LSGFQGDRLPVSRFSKHQLSDLQDTVYLAKAPFHLKKRIYHDIIKMLFEYQRDKAWLAVR